MNVKHPFYLVKQIVTMNDEVVRWQRVGRQTDRSYTRDEAEARGRSVEKPTILYSAKRITGGEETHRRRLSSPKRNRDERTRTRVSMSG